VEQQGVTYTTYSSLPTPAANIVPQPAFAATAQAGTTYTMTVEEVARLREQQDMARWREEQVCFRFGVQGLGFRV